MPAPGSWSSTRSVSFSGSRNIDALVGGSRWSNATVTYSFPTYGSRWGTSSSTGYGPKNGDGEPWSDSFDPLSSSDQSAFTAAAQSWASVANIRFSLVADTSTNVGDIRAAYTYNYDM